MTTLRAGIGSSRGTDSERAGREAAMTAVEGLDGRAPALILVYASVRHDLPALLAGVRAVTGDAPLIGATSSGQLHLGELTPPGTGVAVLAVTSGPYRFGTAAVAGLDRAGVASGAALARAARDAVGPVRGGHAAVIVLADGLVGDKQRFLNGMHRIAGAGVPIVGGAAGDDRQLRRTFVLHGDQVVADGAVAVWVDAPHPLTVVCGHGWRPDGLPLLVTRSEGPIVAEMGGRPAREVYDAHFLAEPSNRVFGSAAGPGYHSEHAFGLIEPNGEMLIRGAYLDDDGAVRTFAPLPPYAAVQVVSCRGDDLLEVTDEVVRGALAGYRPSVVLLFSCVARLDVLAERGAQEAARLQAAAGDVPTFGFYTYGEFAKNGSGSGYHNATLTGIAL